MPDDLPETPSTPAPAAPAAQPAPAGDPPDVQARIDAEAKKARDAAWADARRHYEGKAKGKTQPTPEPQPETTADPFALRDALDDATAEMTLTKGQRQLLRDAVMTKRPGDVDAFVKDYAAKAGWGATTVPNNNQNTNTPAAPPAPSTARPSSDLGAPAGAPAERSDNVLKWTPEDVERFYQT